MRITIYSVLITLLVATNIYSQTFPQWQLPDNATMRIGKGVAQGIAYHPDGTKIAVSTRIGIWIYDVETGEALNLFTADTSTFSSLAFSPDGNTLVSDIHGNRLCMWDANTGRKIRTIFGHSHPSINDIEFSPDGTMFATGGSGSTVRIWEAETGHNIHVIRWHSGSVNSVAFSPDSKTLLSGGSDNRIFLWDAWTGAQLREFKGHTRSVSSVAFHPDGNRFASISYDKTIRMWDVSTGDQISIQSRNDKDEYLVDLSFNPDGRTLAFATHTGTIYILNLPTFFTRDRLRKHTDEILSIAYSPDGKTLASVSDDSTVRLWETHSGWNRQTITGHQDYGNSTVVISPDGNTLVSTGYDGVIFKWDARTGTQLSNFIGHTKEVISLAFSPDGNTIASGSDDGTLRLWDAHTGLQTRTLLRTVGDVGNIIFSGDGKIVVCSIRTGEFNTQPYKRGSIIAVFDVATGTQRHAINAYTPPEPSIFSYDPEFHPTEHTYPINSIALSADGKRIASSSSDKTVRLWDAVTGQHIRVLTQEVGSGHELVFSPDGKMLACVKYQYSGLILFHDVNTGQRLQTIDAGDDHINDIAFSPDGKTVATACQDYTIRLWDVRSATLHHTLIEYTGNYFNWKRFNSVAFSPDGSTLASAGYDGTILIWDTADLTPINTTVGLSPLHLVSPAIGKQLTLSINIGGGQNVMGYQAVVHFDGTALRFVESSIGDYLPDTAYVIDPVVGGNSDSVTLAATTFADVSSNDGTLATITFEVIAPKASTVSLSGVILTDSEQNSIKPIINTSAQITAPEFLPADVNEDGVVNLLDLSFIAMNFGKTGKHRADVNEDGVVNIVDLALVAAAIGNSGRQGAAAPTLLSDLPCREDVQAWLHEARQLTQSDPEFQRGILFLENLLKSLTPTETALLPNYPNPFNPETWIPYQLAFPADVSIAIYTSAGKLVRELTLGHKAVGIYQDRVRAAYWNGHNTQGEPVASGIYFYVLRAGSYTTTRKMSILK